MGARFADRIPPESGTGPCCYAVQVLPVSFSSCLLRAFLAGILHPLPQLSSPGGWAAFLYITQPFWLSALVVLWSSRLLHLPPSLPSPNRLSHHTQGQPCTFSFSQQIFLLAHSLAGVSSSKFLTSKPCLSSTLGFDLLLKSSCFESSKQDISQMLWLWLSTKPRHQKMVNKTALRFPDTRMMTFCRDCKHLFCLISESGRGGSDVRLDFPPLPLVWSFRPSLAQAAAADSQRGSDPCGASEWLLPMPLKTKLIFPLRN